MRRILVLKGGGIRGILQLDALRIIEKHYQKPISEIFDLITGTSIGAITGGILALGTISAENYMNLFLKDFPVIFKKHWWSGIFGPMYKREKFYDMWDKMLGTREILMKECKTKFMCTAVNLCDNRTHFFKSWEEKDGNELLNHQIAKSFAAPIYFGQFIDEQNKAIWIDGGAGETNTPVDRAYAEVINQGWDREPCEILIIGTGFADLSYKFENIKKNGQLKQLITFLRPSEGGLARVQSTINKVAWMEIISKAHPLLNFKYIDTDIGKMFDGTDKIKYIQEYLSFGRVIAEKVDAYLEEMRAPFF